jgi:ABC-2 type transport system permease protein
MLNLKKIKHYLYIFWKFRQLRLMAMMEYRTDFYFWGTVSTLWTVINFFAFGLIANASGSIGGWSRSDMNVLLSTATILAAFMWSFVYQNMSKYTEAVFNGELSGFLVKPVDTYYLLSIKENSYNNIFRLFIGIGMLIWTLHHGHYQVTFLNSLLYILFLVCSIIFIHSVWFIIATFSFWVERLDNINEILPASDRIWYMPRTVYSGAALLLFTVILPLNLMTSLPAEIILGRAAYNWMAYFFVFTVCVFCISRWFFQFSIKKYSSVGQ